MRIRTAALTDLAALTAIERACFPPCRSRDRSRIRRPSVRLPESLLADGGRRGGDQLC